MGLCQAANFSKYAQNFGIQIIQLLLIKNPSYQMDFYLLKIFVFEHSLVV